MKKKKGWKAYVKGLSAKQKEKMLNALLEHWLGHYDSEISYREGGESELGEPPAEECIYWSETGESVLE